MRQRIGVLDNNALEPSSLKYNLWIISPVRRYSLGEKVKRFWERVHTLAPILGKLKTQKSYKKEVHPQLVHLTNIY